jgi:hypothetical protein
VRKAGARVLTLDQIEGLKDPRRDCWGTEEDDDGDPPRRAPCARCPKPKPHQPQPLLRARPRRALR